MAGSLAAVVAAALTLFAAVPALAHDSSDHAQQSLLDGGLATAAWLGAEHMLTGYDHLLFLLGVLFLVEGTRPIARVVTVFALGHVITLLGATLFRIDANIYLIDALIALTICYKAFENLGLFRRLFNIDAPNLLFMVFLFGLIHGFGLSSQVQHMTLVDDPDLVGKILAFNVGVELGQFAGLAAMIGVLRWWRASPLWTPTMRGANAALMMAGLALFTVHIGNFTHNPAPLAASTTAPGAQ